MLPKSICSRLLSVAATAFLCVGSGGFSQTVSTDPVGFITLSITGNSASAPVALSFKGLGLARLVEFQGAAASTTANSLTVSNAAAFTAGQFAGANGPYYLEITGPAGSAGVGSMYDIASNTANSIATVQNLASGIGQQPVFRIRKHWTLASVFGAANEAGLQGGSASSADTIQILNAAAGTYDTYFYSTVGLPGTGWRKAGGGSTDQAATPIYPDDGLLISRNASAPVNVLLLGAVKTGQTSFPVVSGLNIMANPYAAAVKLSTSGLYTGNASTGLASGSASSADQVLIYNGTSYDSYYYSFGGLPGQGWRLAGGGSADQSNVEIPVGSSFLIQRAGAAFDWIAPQHPTSF